ncbi:GNAT family N-acetyltransferase [Caldibacillus lycopersici]|uniref:GNAT family N-acetyltransferase n=1 Tax=Perspicuibacillus lycopersici TaxID=1325689 RepID=A0AAE3LPA7_9BACI|nr:GNAT family N-acetyltransferase [Perspicuibacillus lycopersici]MCU9614742.1 GNAT family N-acetyltransferase [Perspicuibacillus lycopersici]
MDKITFSNIHSYGKVIDENTLYKHIHFPEMLIMYDSNYIDFKQMPTVQEFEETALFLRSYHQKYGQNHVKFYLPENEKPTDELLHYFQADQYEIGFYELYSIQPDQFPSLAVNSDISIQAVSNQSLTEYLQLQFEIDSQFGLEFATQKSMLHKQNFANNNVLQIIAYYKEKPVGTVDVFLSKDIAEIDSFTVLDSFQKKGIGSHMQKFIMERFPQHTICLVADGEDTPREMYKKQNYQYIGYKYEAFKLFFD